MEAHYRAFNGRLVVKVEGSNIKELFEQIGPVAEVLDGDDSCGKCNSPHIYPRAREAQGFTYYELVCSDCGAKLSFGQHKDGGTLWAKRHDDQGHILDYRGWKIYQALPPAPPPQQTTTSAPRSSGPVSAPKPQAVEDPRLADLLARCAAEGDEMNVLGEVCATLGAYLPQNRVDAVWSDAIRKHGDPQLSASAVRPVLSFLLNRLAAEEAAGKRVSA